MEDELVILLRTWLRILDGIYKGEMMRTLTYLCIAGALVFSMGCITLGPKVETRYVIVYPGNPLLITENVSVEGRLLRDEGDTVMQDIGGWWAMPPEHGEELLKRARVKEKKSGWFSK